VAAELRRSTEFSRRDLAAIFTASYQDYFVPFKVDEETLDYMVDAFDLLLAHSLVAVEAGVAVGLANLGRRGEQTWVGGVGVIPARRGAGIGEQLMRGLFGKARDLGSTEMVLEVITENAPAISLYEKLGFEVVRELEVLSLAQAEGGGEAEEVEAAVARRLIARRREQPEPWQRGDETVANLARRDPPPHGLVAGEAAAVYRADGSRVGLLQAAGDRKGLRTLISVLRSRGALSAVNYPSDGPVAAAMREAGADVALRQLEMTLEL
jgi:ribosomal protein S18 acetylase RimI-like enzyme